MPLTTTINTALTASQTSANDLGTASFPLAVTHTASLGNGTGSSQADKLFADTRTLAASATEDLDLAGVLTDAFGAAITFAKIKAILIKAAAANTNNVTIKPATTNGFLGPFNAAADKLSIPPGGMLCIQAPVAGWAVTAGTGDLITMGNSGAGTGVTYDIVLVGTSA